MSCPSHVIEYKCPCCNARLVFGEESQKLTCEFCENTFEVDAVLAYNESLDQSDAGQFQIEEEPHQQWKEPEQEHIQGFQCPACGGEILTDENTAATFCPYCDNPTIMPARVSGGLKPDGIIPFKTNKEDAKAAFVALCKGKPLLPKLFTQDKQLEKITGIYIPFWLYSCSGDLDATYKATRIRTWSDAHYHYTKTDHYLLRRSAEALFEDIPVDGSSKMDDIFMESIEPFDYTEIVDFDTAYLSGFLADKYDVAAENGYARVQERVSQSMEDRIADSLIGYSSALPSSRNIHVTKSKAKYVLLPVWILNIRYHEKLYTFAMNGQTGKITGTLPSCPRKTAMWFGGVFAAATLLATLFQFLI